MDNYQDQARAIWNALDTMLQQDPEGYKRFVTEQLQQGREMIKNKSSGSSTRTESSHLEQAFEKISLGYGAGQGIGSAEKANATNSDPLGGNANSENESTTHLLDDEIGGKKSILEKIVKDTSFGNDDDDEDNVKLDALELNVTKGTREQGKKPLIEEI